MRETAQVARVAVFTAMVVGSNLALAELPNVKLDGALIFLITVIFGAATGGSVALLSEFIWSQFSPWGVSGTYLLPFLLTAELFYVGAGWGVRRFLRNERSGMSDGVLYGGVLGISTFLWDVWTNLGTAVLTTNGSLWAVVTTEFWPGALAFDLAHELSNTLLGLSLVPATLVLIPRLMKGGPPDGIK